MRRKAYAKVNLSLALGAPEPPASPRAGLHPIRTRVQAIDLFDEVEILADAALAGPVLDRAWASDAPVPSPLDWPPEKDLALRAARLLEVELGTPLRVHVTLTKRIPVGGGLGGGSSDAAAVLLALRDRFGPGLTTTRLATLAATLGSDVAFFIDDADPPRPALVQGFGERLTRIAGLTGELLLILPPFACPTGEVYRAFDDAGAAGRLAHAPDLEARGLLFNDLAAPAVAVRPALADLLARSANVLGTDVHVTGSGSTLFALVPPEWPPATDADWSRRLGTPVIRVRLLGAA